ncbi:hypothetical protein [uncultured Roseobacter sp.]|uniref:hypothetical protein n=1 Tax=uncultured Roseobacter sp. TaxID=114847 RepID=UPI00261F57F9|nr:hypothetical protein [uncultured Roseobacter sp.]
MAERDATPHQIGAWGGHESLKEMDAYTKSASKKHILSANEPDTEVVQVAKS